MENDGFVKVANVEASQVWKDLSHHLPRRQDGKGIWRYKEATISEILLHTVSSILEATDAKLIQEVKVLGVTVPEFIAQYGYTKEIMKYANKVLSSLNDNVIPLPYYSGILKGYQLHDADALGYPVGTDLDKEDTLVLQIDCEDSMLDVVSNDIGRKTTTAESHFRIVDYGGPTLEGIL
ncbi:uncharacterized protein RAG0_07479 [Rhynchosporium agropyri]|uniref:Uncharacterized protein n=1 Tax=Rhynchosporium agropyri TaxID=914238 RepID=A0A1E1KLN4_9HELO|nr:uncharacterized protein RAG0_07479 [Rhynchosporium agropyri]